jgi:cytochrome c biogenesis protein CcmG, thiol:disulfide interchange protein DsbE
MNASSLMNKSLLVLALVAVLISPACGQEKKLWAKSIINEKAPELVVEKWLTPQPDTKGKFVLIDLWATWCGPCRKAIEDLNAFHSKFGDKLVVIGISDETEDAVRKMTSPAISYASAIDTKGRMKQELKVTGIPHVILVDPQGIVRWEGYPLLEGHKLTESVINDVIAKHGGS